MLTKDGKWCYIPEAEMKYLVMLAIRCRNARRYWYRMKKQDKVPDDFLSCLEGAWREANNALQGAKAIATYKHVDLADTVVVVDMRSGRNVYRRIYLDFSFR